MSLDDLAAVFLSFLHVTLELLYLHDCSLNTQALKPRHISSKNSGS